MAASSKLASTKNVLRNNTNIFNPDSSMKRSFDWSRTKNRQGSKTARRESNELVLKKSLSNIQLLARPNTARKNKAGSKAPNSTCYLNNFLTQPPSALCTSRSNSMSQRSLRDAFKFRAEGIVHRIRVLLRLRPLNSREESLVEGGAGNVAIQVVGSNGVRVEESNSTLIFDGAFSKESQAEFYEKVAYDTVEDVLEGYNGTIFAYGPTGTGKTYTMLGTSCFTPELVGIIPRTSDQIFKSLDEYGGEYELRISALEIYKEVLRDLLYTESPIELKIKESNKRGVYVEGLKETLVRSKEEFLEAVLKGGENRVVAETRSNQNSSRSHAIFILQITKRSEGKEQTGRLNLVDLAGSEKLSSYYLRGRDHIEETKKINKSLSALGNVIYALTNNSDHIPYRDSKLTRILQESLGGNYKTTLIITMSPYSGSIEESFTALKFAQRAKHIKNRVHANITRPLDSAVSSLKEEIRDTRAQLSRMWKVLQEKLPVSELQSLNVQLRNCTLISEEVCTSGEGQEKLKEYAIEIDTQKAIIDEYEDSIDTLKVKLAEEKKRRQELEERLKEYETLKPIIELRKQSESIVNKQLNSKIELLMKEISGLNEALAKSEHDYKDLLNRNRPQGNDDVSHLKNQLVNSELANKTLQCKVSMLERKLSLEETRAKHTANHSQRLIKLNKDLESALELSYDTYNKLRQSLDPQDNKLSDVIATVLTLHEKTPRLDLSATKANRVRVSSKVSNKFEPLTPVKTEETAIKRLEYNIMRSKLDVQTESLEQLDKYYKTAKEAIVSLRLSLESDEDKENSKKRAEGWISLITRMKEDYEKELKDKKTEIRKLQEELSKHIKA
eukprot:TRINITY_DN8012_c0_g1_i9.p1 TRINITY_DN8012_c0_g1~~TRINITY_DN8012_c0_g1_i9.p1  ORF type:complete len:843 (-),score=250.96 TRINITY_DN8012_c0_g1_i9:154-2682(-)